MGVARMLLERPSVLSMPVEKRFRFWMSLVKIGRRIWGHTSTSTQRILGGLLVKYGLGVVPNEATVMQLIARSTAIPVPRVVDCVTWEDRTLIVQDYVNGIELAQVFRKLDAEQLRKVGESLRTLLAQLRSIPHPPDAGIAAFGGGPVLDLRISMFEHPFGPFSSLREFNQALLEHSTLEIPEDEREAFESTISPVYRCDEARYKIVLTHDDLHPANILVNRRDHSTILAIIDWEYAAWMPEYW